MSGSKKGSIDSDLPDEPSKRTLGNPVPGSQSYAQMENTSQHKENTQLRTLHPETETPDALQTESHTNTSNSDTPDVPKKAGFECPICGESMITLLQLNQHIDDSHSESGPYSTDTNTGFPTTPKHSRSTHSAANEGSVGKSGTRTPEGGRHGSAHTFTPTRRSIKLDLYEDSGFGISAMSNNDELLSRSHWRKSSAGKGSVCKDCGKHLNVKNGVVNCRKCGDLFCNEHTSQVAKLGNGACSQEPVVFDSRNGRFAQVCRSCFSQRPLLAAGPQANSMDLTDQFVSHRAAAAERFLISRQVIVNRYLKLVDILTQALVEERLSGVFSYMDTRLAAQEKEIVNWEADADASHCRICFEPFGIFSRKHHCRLCGCIVNEMKSGSAYGTSFCSVQVPVPLLLVKLPQLNYSPRVVQAWSHCVQDTTEGYSFRCCRTCKNLLLGTRAEGPSRDEVADECNLFLAKKASIHVIIGRYKALVQEHSDHNHVQMAKLRSKLGESARDLEAWLRAFTGRHFRHEEGRLVARDQSRECAGDAKLIANVQAAALMFLQDTLLEAKRWNDEAREIEKRRLESQRPADKPPSLTKRQIRELREQLMVLNEQQFIVQQSKDAARKARRFDETVVLEENEGELQRTIAHVTEQLGEHAFT